LLVNLKSKDMIQENYYPLIVSDRDGKLLVAIKSDGNIEFGEGVSVDKASKEFYEAVERLMKDFGVPGVNSNNL
jgi:hypothetical protein